MNSLKKDIAKLKRERKICHSVRQWITVNDDCKKQRTISATDVDHLFIVHEEHDVGRGDKNIYDFYLYRGSPYINASGQQPLKPWCMLKQIFMNSPQHDCYHERYFMYDDRHRLFQLNICYDNDRIIRYKTYDLIYGYSVSNFLNISRIYQLFFSILYHHSYKCDFNEEPYSTFYLSGNPSQILYMQFDYNTKKSYYHRNGNEPAFISTYIDNKIYKAFYKFGVKYAESHYYMNDVRPFHTAVYLEPEEIPTFFIPDAPPPPSYIYPVVLKPYIGDAFFECCVCLGVENTDDKISMPCNHTAHESCVTIWLEKQRTCPQCRAAF